MHSREQGVLISRIWEEHLGVVSRMVKEMEEHNVKADRNSLGEIKRIHESYSRYMEKVKERQRQGEAEKESIMAKIGILKKENEYLRRKEIRREGEINKLVKQHEIIIAKNKELSSELKYLIDY